MKLDIQKFATGGVIMNIVKEYTYEQELKETVKIIATPDNSETEFDFQNDFTCSIDDEGWTSTGENGSYYKIFNTKEKKTITFTYLNNDNPNYKIIGDIDIDTTDLHKFYNLTICVDKQPMTNPSSDLKKYNIKLLSPLRSYLDAFDQFVMSDDGKYKVIRNIEKYNGSLRKLKTPIEETVGKLEITLFEGTNYFYIENTGKYLMNVQYLTNSKLNKTYATKMELNSKLEQTVEGFTLTVSKKVDNDEIISTINQSAEQVKINADKISLEGKTIDLTGDNMIIKSKNFNVDEEGNMTCTSGTFSGIINTSEDLKVGNNIYIGKDQNPTTYDSKYIRMSNSSYVSRTHWSDNKEQISIKSNSIYLNGDVNLKNNCSFNDRAFFVGTSNSVYIQGNNNGLFSSHAIQVASDKRLKQKVEDIDVSWIDNIDIKQFEYKYSPNIKQIGVIAQDYIDKDYSKYFLGESNKKFIDAESGILKEEKYYSVAYGNITNALIKYCQELKKQVIQLEERVSKLEGEVNE